MLVRFQPVSSIFNEIDSLINSTLIPFPEVRRIERSGRIAGVSVNESAEQVTVRVELPGVSKEDITVNVNNDVLTISGERKAPERKENEQYIRNEISYGKFERSLSLPYPVDVEKVMASQENGVLTVVLPKHENAKPKQITIR
jgi:HSP20 family protein